MSPEAKADVGVLTLTPGELAAVRACVTRCFINRRALGASPEEVLLAAIAVHEAGIAEAAARTLRTVREAEKAQLNFERLLSATSRA